MDYDYYIAFEDEKGFVMSKKLESNETKAAEDKFRMLDKCFKKLCAANPIEVRSIKYTRIKCD